MFNLDLKRAEAALEAGRLDDAFRVLRSSAEAQHSRGQQLIDRLIASLLNRSQDHFEQQHFQQARRDAELAAKLGGGQVQIVQRLQQVDAKDHSIANRASKQVNEHLVSEISTLVSEGKHEAAVGKYREVRQRRPIADDAKRLVEPSVRWLTEQVRADLVSGRLDRCESTLRTLAEAGLAGPNQQELKVQLERCYNVRRAVKRSDYAEAIRDVRLLTQVVPDAVWVQEIASSLQSCLECVEQVKAGPFGLLGLSTGNAVAAPRFAGSRSQLQEPVKLGDPINSQPMQGQSPLKSSRSILQVDRVGSLLIVDGPVCSIGGATNRQCDVSLQTDGVGDRIQICRDAEDYFATSTAAFFVNDILAERHLLTDGDTIHVGSRGRLKFAQPVPASTSAILQITGSKMKRRDVRSIVLVDDALVFSQRGGHFRLPNGQPSVIFRPQADRPGEFLIHQKGSQEHQLLSAGDSLRINDCHFALASIEPTGDVL